MHEIHPISIYSQRRRGRSFLPFILAMVGREWRVRSPAPNESRQSAIRLRQSDRSCTRRTRRRCGFGNGTERRASRHECVGRRVRWWTLIRGGIPDSRIELENTQLFARTLARLGGRTLGIDASESNIRIASMHASADPLFSSSSPSPQSVCSSKKCSVSVCVLCASCLLLGCQLREFSGAVRGARYSISLLGSFSGLLDALGGQGIPVRCFNRFALPCPAASCVGKPTMVVVAVQGPPDMVILCSVKYFLTYAMVLSTLPTITLVVLPCFRTVIQWSPFLSSTVGLRISSIEVVS